MLDTTVGGLASLSGTLLVLTTTAVALRFYARHKQKSNFQWDDWLILPAWIFFVGLVSISFYGISRHFMGYHEPHNQEVVNKKHSQMIRTYFALDVITILALGVVKLSVLLFYRRVFYAGIRDIFHYITITAIGLVILWTIGFFIGLFVMCPLPSYWEPGNSVKCKGSFPNLLASSISDFVLDFLLLCIPIPKIWSLKTTTRRKSAITGVFLLALVGFGVCTARMVITIHLVKDGRPVDDEDSYQANTSAAYYIILEAGLTLLAANLPSLWYYVSGVKPEKVLRSVRSILSLRSSCSSQGTGEATNVTQKPIIRARSEEHETEPEHCTDIVVLRSDTFDSSSDKRGTSTYEEVSMNGRQQFQFGQTTELA